MDYDKYFQFGKLICECAAVTTAQSIQICIERIQFFAITNRAAVITAQSDMDHGCMVVNFVIIGQSYQLLIMTMPLSESLPIDQQYLNNYQK